MYSFMRQAHELLNQIIIQRDSLGRVPELVIISRIY
jgi:hypothetical protein